MNRFLVMFLGTVTAFTLFTVQATAGPPSSSQDEVKCDASSCPILTSAPALEDCTIDFATCVVDQPSECDSSDPTDIEDTTTDIASSAARQSESNHGAIPQAIGAIEVINVGTSIYVAVLSAGYFNSKADFSTRYKKEVSKRIICMVPMDTDSNNPQVEKS